MEQNKRATVNESSDANRASTNSTGSHDQTHPSKIERTASIRHMKDNVTAIKTLAPDLKDSDPNLTELDLNCDNGKKPLGAKGAKLLAEALQNNTSLTILNLKGNEIGKKGGQDIALSLLDNNSLVELIVSDNDLQNDGATNIVTSLGRCKNIKRLEIDKNQIGKETAKALSYFLQGTTTLQSLNISNNPKIGKDGASYISDGLRKNRSLYALYAKQISLKTSGTKVLCEAFRVNPVITILDLSDNLIKDEGAVLLAEALKAHKTVVKLVLAGNEIGRKGAAALGQLVSHIGSQLKHLDLSNNKLKADGMKELATGIGGNKSLQVLIVKQNKIKDAGARVLLDALAGNETLNFLDLSRNFIKDKGMRSLNILLRRHPLLKTLVLNQNLIESGAEGFGHDLGGNRSLTHLYLSGNPLRSHFFKELGIAVSKNYTLKHIEIAKCSLSDSSLHAMQTAYSHSFILQDFSINGTLFAIKDFSSRGLTSFPMNILTMTHLKSLILDNNGLTELPASISELKLLKELSLKHNKLEALPFTLAELKGTLAKLEVEGNPLITPPKEIVRKGRKEILEYLSELMKGSEPCYRVKLMIVGQENVGKTTLVNSLAGKRKNKKKNPTPNMSTDGIDIDDWTINVPLTKDNKVVKQDVTFSIWDFAGQELYYASHQFFLSDRSIFIIVFDLRYDESNSRVEFWLQSIAARTKSAPIMILGTHADDPKCTDEYIDNVIQKIQVKYLSKFPNIKSIVFADVSKDVKDIKEGLKKLINIEQTKLSMGEMMPKTYLELEKLVKEAKTKQLPPLVTWQEFVRFGKLANITDENVLLRATKFFHELGTLVYFDDKKSGLKDLVILEPQFITDLLSTIITTKHKFVKDGVLLHKDLDQIWRDAEFPKELHPMFLALLEKFEILYCVPTQQPSATQPQAPQSPQLLAPAQHPQSPPSPQSSNPSSTTTSPAVSPGSTRKTTVHNLKASSNNTGSSRNLTMSGGTNPAQGTVSRSSAFLMLKAKNYDFIHGKSLIPCLLASNQPNLDQVWPKQHQGFQLDRTFFFDFIPSGLFARLMIRMLQYCENVFYYWKNGAIMTKGSDSILLVMDPLELKLTTSIRFTQANTHTYQTQRVITETVKALVRSWFHIDIQEVIPCSHCIANGLNPTMFNVDDLTLVVAQGGRSVECRKDKDIVTLSLEHFAPDISMVDIHCPRVEMKNIKIEKQLGQGAFGKIFSAVWNNHPVAVKELIINYEDKMNTIEVFNEFRKEVWLMSRLRHPNVVNIMAYTLNPFAVVMEKINEGDLYSFLKSARTPLSWGFRLRVALDIAQGMNFLHSQNPPIVHRDLKSPNILLASLNESSPIMAKVSDFGTSQHLFISAFKEKAAFRTVTLPTWLAPEVISEEEYTEKSDIYAFGIMLWELYTREHPFANYNWMSELEDAVVAGQRPPIPGECPPAYAKFMESCWHQDASLRPPFQQCVNILHTLFPALAPNLKWERPSFEAPKPAHKPLSIPPQAMVNLPPPVILPVPKPITPNPSNPSSPVTSPPSTIRSNSNDNNNNANKVLQQATVMVHPTSPGAQPTIPPKQTQQAEQQENDADSDSDSESETGNQDKDESDGEVQIKQDHDELAVAPPQTLEESYIRSSAAVVDSKAGLIIVRKRNKSVVAKDQSDDEDELPAPPHH